MKHIFLLLLMISCQLSYGQAKKEQPFVLGVTETVHSAILNEDRGLNIYLPEGYSPDSAATYPVIYLLDGSANEDFVHIVGVVQFLTMIGTMPKSIVVGIANVDRKRDFTFPTTIEQDKKDFPTTGGSEPFMAFLEKELQPFIEKKYRTNATRTLIGQSLGGLLAIEVFLRHPSLFSQYIIVSPSLWWDNESLLTLAPALLDKLPAQETKIYISVGNEEPQMVDDAKRFSELLNASGKKNLHTFFVPLPEEDHLTILHNSVYKAFGILYQKVK
jgi:uncharacterized protein